MRLVCCYLVLAACHHPDDTGGTNPLDPSTDPVVHDDTISIAEDGRITVSQLMMNDQRVEYVKAGSFGPLHGTLDEYGNYTPDPGFHGVDTFTYVGLQDWYGETSPEAKVRVDIASDGIPYEQATRLSAVGTGALASGDLDGDGRVDLVLANPNDDTATILVNGSTGPGDFRATEIRFEGGHQPNAIAVADFDGDGKPDIVTSSFAGIIVLRNITANGTLAFDAPVTITSESVSGVIAADLDGDGRVDIASVGEPSWGQGSLEVRLGQGSPGAIAFGPSTTFATPENPTQIALVDAGGARGADLAVLTYGGTISLFVNTTAVGDAAVSFAARVDRATGEQPKSLVIADLDGDGRADLGVVDAANDLWVYQNQGPQSFEAARVIDLSPGGGPIAAVDLDHQGAIDLVVGGDGYANTLEALVNHGTAQDPYAFASEPLIAGSVTQHGPLVPQTNFGPSTLAFVELDGVAPPEIVLSGYDGTYVLFGD